MLNWHLDWCKADTTMRTLFLHKDLVADRRGDDPRRRFKRLVHWTHHPRQTNNHCDTTPTPSHWTRRHLVPRHPGSPQTKTQSYKSPLKLLECSRVRVTRVETRLRTHSGTPTSPLTLIPEGTPRASGTPPAHLTSPTPPGSRYSTHIWEGPEYLSQLFQCLPGDR